MDVQRLLKILKKVVKIKKNVKTRFYEEKNNNFYKRLLQLCI